MVDSAVPLDSGPAERNTGQTGGRHVEPVNPTVAHSKREPDAICIFASTSNLSHVRSR